MGRPRGAKNKPYKIKDKQKELVLNALSESMGILKPALKAVSLDRSTFNTYYNNDPLFAKRVDEIREESIDYVEMQLLKQIKDGGAAQTIFFLKTKGKSRGYIETTEMNMNLETVKIKYIMPDGTPLNQIDTTQPLQLNDNQIDTTPIIKIDEPGKDIYNP